METDLQVPGPDSRRTRRWTVGMLCRAIADTLDARLNPVEVTGEITGFTRVVSGHCYFALKDESGQIRCAMFRRASGLIDFRPENGEQVVVRGRLGVYDPRGELQLVVESMSRAGAGTLFEQFLRLKAKLESEGLFAPTRKRPVPLVPRGIGIVTSMGGAAIHDVLTALKRRAPHVPVLLAAAQVQGSGAPSQLVAALTQLADVVRLQPDSLFVEVILLVRGGGSIEDLMAFNSEELARAIAKAPVPVISGVGHETDFTIADFVADLRAPTPTAAAELAAHSRDSLFAELHGAWQQLRRRAGDHLERHSQALDYLSYKVARPSAAVTRQGAYLTACARRLSQEVRSGMEGQNLRLERHVVDLPRSASKALDRERQRLDRVALRLHLMDPTKVLSRGYVWVMDPAGNALTRVAGIERGDVLHMHFMDGEVVAKTLDMFANEKGRLRGP